MFLKKIQKTFIFRLTFTQSYGIIHNGFVLRLVANPLCGVCWRVRFYPNSKHRLGSSPRVKIEGAQKQVWRNGRRAGFRFQWRDSCGFKSRHLHQTKRAYPCGMLFLFYEGGGFEIGRKLQGNLCEAPNSLNGCLSAKAATGGNPVTCTMVRAKLILSPYFLFKKPLPW